MGLGVGLYIKECKGVLLGARGSLLTGVRQKLDQVRLDSLA